MSISAAYIVPHPPLIVPEVGQGQEGQISATANSYHQVAKHIAQIKPQTIVLFTPHSTVYGDYIHISPGKSATGSLAKFGAPTQYKANYDHELIHALDKRCKKMGFSAGTLGEQQPSLDHGTLVPLHFINQYWTNYRLVRISASGLPREELYRFGMLLQEELETLNRTAILVASGDLSHRLQESGPYGFAPEGPELDKALTCIIETGNFQEFLRLSPQLCEKGAECGLPGFIMMSGALDRRAVEPNLLSYQDVTGVGYAVAFFTDIGPDPQRNFLERFQLDTAKKLEDLRDKEDPLVHLARNTLEHYIRSGKKPPLPEGLPQELLQKRAGSFVSIKKHGQLRGCIGTIRPTCNNLAEEIVQNAVSSGTEDPRFSPVTVDELDMLVYSVDVLSPPEPVPGIEALDVERYGVIVTSGRRRGLLLPNLEGVDTPEEQIRIACQKAGIAPGEAYTLERFEVVRHQ